MRELERQRWLAGLALLAAVPLPFTGISTWPFLTPYVAVALWVLLRRRVVPALPAWVENLLAPLVLVAVAAPGGLRSGVLQPVSHLALLVATIRLPGCAAPRRSRLSLATTAIIAAAGIASSTHPSLVVYLLVALVACVVGAGRSILSALRSRVPEGEGGSGWAPARAVALTVVVAVVIAVPLFAALPRLRSPFVAASSGTSSVSGYRSEITLHGIGAIKVSEKVALTIRFPDEPQPRREWLRVAGATLNHYRGGTWVEGRAARPLPLARQGQTINLWPGSRLSGLVRAELALERQGENLFVQPGAVSLVPPLSVGVERTALGVLRISKDAEPPLEYSVQFEPENPLSPPPEEADLEIPGRVRERIAPLVREVVGEGATPLTAAVALEDHLRTGYSYSLDVRAPLREDPVVWFLLRGREGHCEFFASAMALMLRVAAVPARVQVGFAGGEAQADGSFLVRDSRAHAWVLAWVAGRWRVFDPTPLEGQPTADIAGGRWRLPWRWEDFEAAWDRWVLTFTLLDQAELLRRTVTWLTSHLGLVGLVAGLAGLVAALLAGTERWRSRARASRRAHGDGRGDAVVRAVERVMRAARRHGLDVPPSISPRRFAAVAAAAFPGVGESLGWLVAAHERSRYDEGAPPPRRELRRRLAEVERAVAVAQPAGATARGERSATGTGPASQAASHQATTRNGTAASKSTR